MKKLPKDQRDRILRNISAGQLWKTIKGDENDQSVILSYELVE